MSDHPPLITLEQISRIYSKGQCTALNEVTLSIEPHEYMAIMGPSGSGKSTLLHILGGLDHPTTGRVLFEGHEYLTRRQWARVRAKRIGFVFQTFNLLPTLTAEQNVEIPMLGIIKKTGDRRQRTSALLSRVGMSRRSRHRPPELSGGEKQRLAIARSLANAPDLVLADEPTGNLDSKNSLEILDLLEDIHSREGVALVIVTHDREITRRADRVVTINDGRITSNGDIEKGKVCI
jgi:putative ABC transport system ATP-binding protein